MGLEEKVHQANCVFPGGVFLYLKSNSHKKGWKVAASGLLRLYFCRKTQVEVEREESAASTYRAMKEREVSGRRGGEPTEFHGGTGT